MKDVKRSSQLLYWFQHSMGARAFLLGDRAKHFIRGCTGICPLCGKYNVSYPHLFTHCPKIQKYIVRWRKERPAEWVIGSGEWLGFPRKKCDELLPGMRLHILQWLIRAIELRQGIWQHYLRKLNREQGGMHSTHEVKARLSFRWIPQPSTSDTSRNQPRPPTPAAGQRARVLQRTQGLDKRGGKENQPQELGDAVITTPLVRDSFMEQQPNTPSVGNQRKEQAYTHTQAPSDGPPTPIQVPTDGTRETEESYEVPCPHDLDLEEPERDILMTYIVSHKGGGMWSVRDGLTNYLTVANTGKEYCDCGQFKKGKGTHSGCRHLDVLTARGVYASPPSSSRAWDGRKKCKENRTVSVHPYWYGVGRYGVDLDLQQGNNRRKVTFAHHPPPPPQILMEIPVWNPGDTEDGAIIPPTIQLPIPVWDPD